MSTFFSSDIVKDIKHMEKKKMLYENRVSPKHHAGQLKSLKSEPVLIKTIL